MASGQDRSELDARARQGETVVPGGTGGKSLEAQEHLAEGYIYLCYLFFLLSYVIYIMRINECLVYVINNNIDDVEYICHVNVKREEPRRAD